jgi:hypothetical protein
LKVSRLLVVAAARRYRLALLQKNICNGTPRLARGNRQPFFLEVASDGTH